MVLLEVWLDWIIDAKWWKLGRKQPNYDDTSFFNASINSSQNINPATAITDKRKNTLYATILNSSLSKLNTNAPDDLYVALGENGRH